MRPTQTATQNRLGLLQGLLILAVVTALVSFIGAAVDTSRFYQVYLFSFVLWAELAIGCLGLVMLNHLVKGRWFYAVQRFAEAGARTLPLLAIFFIPVIAGLGDIYPGWVDEAARSDLSGGKVWMLQPTFFVVRTFIYIAGFSILAYGMTRISYQRDRADSVSQENIDHARNFAALGMVIYVLLVTLCAFDWTMSLLPKWFSTAYGWLVLSRMGLITMSFVVLMLPFFWNQNPLDEYVDEGIFTDIGNLLFVTLLVWVYMTGLQFLVTWQGNVTYYVLWYDIHTAGNWETFVMIFAAVHALILLVLMAPGTKRSRIIVLTAAGLLFILRIFEMAWYVMPTYYDSLTFSIFDVFPVVALGALWLAATLWLLSRESLAPKFHRALAGDSHAHSAAGAGGEAHEGA